MNGGMSGRDLVNIVLASGTGKLNRKFRSMKSSLFNHFNEDKNIDREDGDGRDYNVVVEGENVTPYRAGSIWPTGKRRILNQYHIDYMNVVATVVFEGTESSLNLGGYSIEDFMGGDAPQQMFPTLINEMAVKLGNVKESFIINQSDAHYHKQTAADGSPNVDGFDVIFEPDTEYGGKGYKALGEHDWDSLLMGTSVYRHNPLYRKFGSTDDFKIHKDLNAALADISKGRADVSDADDPEKMAIMGMCGPGTFGRLAELFNSQIQRTGDQQHSSTIGIKKPIMWDLWGLELHADHYCPEDRIYLWSEEHIKKICQTGPRSMFDLRRVRLAFAQDEINCPWTIEYNLGCSARWQTCLLEIHEDMTISW